MKQFKRKLLCATIGLGLGMSVASAQATGWPVFDVMRTAEFAVQGVQRLLSLISEYQKVHSKKEELKTWEVKKKIDPKKEQPSCSTYSYIEGVAPMSQESSTYLKQTEAGAVEEEIQKQLFLPADRTAARATDKERQEVELRRRKYMEELAKEILSLSEGVKENAAAELSTLEKATSQKDNKPVQAGSNIQQVDLLVQTKKTMVEQKGADIILQAKIMELEALEMLLGTDVFLVANPEVEGSTRSGSSVSGSGGSGGSSRGGGSYTPGVGGGAF